MVEEAISFWTEIQRYEDMLEADPRSYCFAPLSELYRKLGLLDDAIHVAKKGCDLHPDYPGAFFALGTAYLDKGRREEARVALERVVVLSPDNVRAQKLLGQLYAETGEIALAEKALEQVLLQNPDDTESELLLRSIASSSEKTLPDEEFLEEAEVIEELTELFEEEKEKQVEVKVEVEKVEETVTPEMSEVSEEPAGFAWAEEAEEAGWVEEVEETPEILEQHTSPDPLTTATLAELYVSQGFLDKAIVIYQELLAAQPANSPYLLRCAELKAERVRQREAELTPAPAAPQKTPAAQEVISPEVAADAELVTAKTGHGSTEVELSRWLENIRRRRDGV